MKSDEGKDIGEEYHRDMQPVLKPVEYKRDEHGKFEQHGTGLIKKSQKINPAKIDGRLRNGGYRTGAGRPKGSPNKVGANLKQMILQALDEVGGHEYLKTLAVENSSAFAGLLGKVLPAVLATDLQSNGSVKTKLTFERVIVWPDGRREIEGVTPKALPAPLPQEDEPKITFKDQEFDDKGTL